MSVQFKMMNRDRRKSLIMSANHSSQTASMTMEMMEWYI